MRDLETISMAITAAETGHLVFGTLHTLGAPQTVDRIIDVFPTDQQEQIRTQLAEAIRGVVSQTLLRTADGKGRVAALEIMVANSAIRNLIREAKTFQIHSVIETATKDGMCTMDQYLKELVQSGRVTREEALAKVHDISSFDVFDKPGASSFGMNGGYAPPPAATPQNSQPNWGRKINY